MYAMYLVSLYSSKSWIAITCFYMYFEHFNYTLKALLGKNLHPNQKVILLCDS